jgi:hypothetical protein
MEWRWDAVQAPHLHPAEGSRRGQAPPTAMGCSTGCSGGLPAELGWVPGGGGGQMRGCSRSSSVRGRCCASIVITSCCRPEPELATGRRGIELSH